MAYLQFPWLELMLLVPLAGAAVVALARDAELARRRALVTSALTLALSLAAWYELASAGSFEATRAWTSRASGWFSGALVLDGLTAPLLPLVALLTLLLCLTTPRTKVRRVPFASTLISLSLQLALFSCRMGWGVIFLLALQTFPLWFELRARQRGTRVFTLHMALSTALMAIGWGLLTLRAPGAGIGSNLAYGALLGGMLIRCGMLPFHCWVTDLWENATLSSALLFVLPLSGAYAALRLLFPIAPGWALEALAVAALATALYSAALATVQREPRRFLCHLLLSNSALAVVGLQMADPIGVTATLAAWIAVALSLLGLGLTLRAVESRVGKVSLVEYHGLYQHMPLLAIFFLVTGLSAIGFPGTIGFVAVELLVEGAIRASPAIAVAVVLVTALNGVALLRTYFCLFTGTQHTSSISIDARPSEKLAVLALMLIVVGGGLWPQPGVASRYHVARELIKRRAQTNTTMMEVATTDRAAIHAANIPSFARD